MVIVALIHAVIGYAFITGLAYKYVKEVQENLETFEVEEPPPPPEEEPPPPPPEEVATQPPPVVTPPPIVRTNTPPPVQIQAVRTPPAVYNPVPIAAPPAPPAPVAPPAPKAVVSKAARAKGNLGRFFGADNYPASAIRAEAEGRATFRIGIGTNGRVTSCEITGSTGNSALDDATCRGARRATFEPAQDQAGNPIASTLTQSITWQLER
ncbi:protein TonB [Sphingomonas japonica]|uniref:Protein TonB n=1 Tax=Sphingomonas japonica TaxID=511662 RepID=A0ABX0U382_9SPHN|nr:protein TonB [Sphingomonas japonica]